jgi:deoxyribonuclease IV
MLLLGAHMSISGGLHLAFSRAEEVGCTAMQIFTKNASQWRARPIAEGEAQAFRQAWRKSSIGPVIAHDSYLINLGAADPLLWEKSIAAFLEEMQRCDQLGIGELVMHPGAHVGTGENAGIARIAEAFRRIFAEAPASVTVLLENTAGQGSYLGGRFEHLTDIMERVPQGRFGICFDTCHAFAAGYDLSTLAGYQAVMEEFQNRVGCEQIRAFHLNDTKKGLGSRTDRHEHIGQGALGAEAFRSLLHDVRFAAVPKILETPKGDDGEADRLNLKTLRELAAA